MAGVGAVITTGAGLVTVNVAVAVLVSHLSVAVNVTVTLPPVHRSGAVGLLLASTGAQPPLTLAVANHVWNGRIQRCLVGIGPSIYRGRRWQL